MEWEIESIKDALVNISFCGKGESVSKRLLTARTLDGKLTDKWLEDQRCFTYCMFGSKKHLMENIFNGKSMPFYKFGYMIFLKNIPTGEMVRYIRGQFNDS